MATVGKLVAVLTAHTAPFQRNMKRSQSSVQKLTATIQTAKAAIAGFLAVMGVTALIRSSITLYARQEQAVRRVADALRLAGDASRESLDDIQKFAKHIQSITTIGDEAVLELAALGASLGKLSGDQLKEATKAAIGLSKGMNIELVAAMRLVARAAIGDTTQLTRYGIKLDETLSTQEKFARLLEIGADSFSLAEGEAKTMTGQLDQFKNEMSDLAEDIGRGLVPMIVAAAKALRAWLGDADAMSKKVTSAMEGLSTAVAFVADVVQANVVAWKFLKAVASGVVASVLTRVDELGTGLVELTNQIPGVDLQWSTSVSELAEGARMAADEVEKEFRDAFNALATDSWGDRVKQTFDDIARKADEVAESPLFTPPTDLGIAGEAAKELEKLQREAERVFERTRTPMEQYTKSIDDLNTLLEKGLIDWETYTRAVRQARDALESATSAADAASTKAPDIRARVIEGVSTAVGEFRVGVKTQQDVMLEQIEKNTRGTKDNTDDLGLIYDIAGALT